MAATSQREDGRLTIALEDDGPGLPAADHGYAPRRPVDEKVSETGLGLAMVHDLASLYSGSIVLWSSSPGGCGRS
ncbi:MAG: hypothetical protein DME08_10420 [Candidatus Rokuibacteriota bacterium]|nr:MAG: hypothetical protein DME08_10420 [Candidatus Rokubacteria bacterium]